MGRGLSTSEAELFDGGTGDIFARMLPFALCTVGCLSRSLGLLPLCASSPRPKLIIKNVPRCA